MSGEVGDARKRLAEAVRVSPGGPTRGPNAIATAPTPSEPGRDDEELAEPDFATAFLKANEAVTIREIEIDRLRGILAELSAGVGEAAGYLSPAEVRAREHAAWEMGRLAGMEDATERQRRAHWSHIGKAYKPTTNPFGDAS